MNLNMIDSKKETEDLLLSITRNCETLIEQTHIKTGRNFGLYSQQINRNFSFQSEHQLWS